MAKQTKRINSVTINRMVDDNPDTSYLGEYSNLSDSGDAIDRKERGDMLRNEYRYFNPTNPEYVEQDYERMESLNRGGWCYLGIQAQAEVIVNGTIQRITSGGLWGIESDSGSDYFEEVAAEQCEELRDTLAELGFTKRQIDAAFKARETVED